MNEFDIIKHYFAKHSKRNDVTLGVGDDAAIVNVPPQQQLLITTDTCIAGVHFPLDTEAESIGHKSLAVNLSDLAAMGAHPAWVTLALTLPSADNAWLDAFCAGFFKLAEQFNVALIGGDLTHGPLSITIQAMGFIPKEKALLRSAAKVGDLIYVTGNLGDAGLALRSLQQKMAVDAALLKKLNYPTPRVDIGEALRDIAHAAIDISDGLHADLTHILAASDVGARINVDQLPLSSEMKKSLSHDDAIQLALSAGDDYELCFTASPKNSKHIEAIAKEYHCAITCIGEITAEKKLLLQEQHGKTYHDKIIGYRHF